MTNRINCPVGWLIDGKVHCAACCDGPMFRSEEDSWIPLDDADPADILHADASCTGKGPG